MPQSSLNLGPSLRKVFADHQIETDLVHDTIFRQP